MLGKLFLEKRTVIMHFILLNLFMLVGGIAGGLLSSIASMASLASYPVLLMYHRFMPTLPTTRP